ncbi:APC family permease [Sporolactobacillus spathodeae]|uniref:Amino acid efflux transporter n=1 Tax=Sporolactobacillus spathodeae TaxID=1465502 RepID=A0ABS2Q6V6_9BACL|nr:amino acid permease [Sporolactobacillus spathodeae]MBM7657531.1 amino acid efflux transporter [Sporolactobacillus spathodeae]
MEQPTLKRSINWIQGTALTISAVLGCGILVLPSITAANAGPASLLSWAIMALFAFPIVLTLARLSTMIPNAGGITAYVRAAFGPHVSYLLSWVMLGSVPVGAPTLALTGAIYMNNLYHLNQWEIVALAAAMLLISLALNMKGIELSSKVSLPVVLIILALIFAAITVSLPRVTIEAFHPFLPRGWAAVGSTSVLIFFSFVGWEMITPLSEEFENPKRDLTISLLLGAFCISVLYLLLSFVTVGTHAYGDGRMASLSLLLSAAFGSLGTILVTLLALFITFIAVHANIAGFSRMVYAQARDGYFPKFFSVLHEKNQTPIRVLAAMGAAFLSLFLLYGVFQPSLGLLIQATSTVFIVSYVLTMLAALKMIKRDAIAWLLALIACVTTLVILLFSGWLIFYPFLLVAAGELSLNPHLFVTRKLKMPVWKRSNGEEEESLPFRAKR